MAKPKLNELTEKQLISLQQQLEHEIETLRNVIEASNTTVFDLLISEVKKEMQDNIAEEEWKILKENQKKIESYRSIEKTLQNQEDLLERKNEELEDVKDALKYYQPSIFEQYAEETEFKTETGYSIKTGDVYKSIPTSNEDEIFYFAVKKSSEIEGSFAIISNSFEGERMLQYPANLSLIEDARYIGNIYVEDGNCEDAKKCLNIIADCSQNVAESETHSCENSTDS